MKHLKFTTMLLLLLFAAAGLQAQCNGPVSSINENFNAIGYGQRPSCWNGFYNAVPSYTANYCYNGEYWIQRTNSGTTLAEHFMIVLPQSTMKGPLSFDLRKLPNSGNLTLEVGSLSDPNDLRTFTLMRALSYGSSTAQRFTVDFTTYNGTDKYIALRAYLLPSQGFAFDNLTWSGPLPVVTPALPPKGF